MKTLCQKNLKLFQLLQKQIPTNPAFCAYLMRIGNGQEKTNNCNKIQIPNNFVIPFTHEIKSLNLLFNVTYPDLRTFYSNPSFITFRISLTTKNDFVHEINDMLIHRFPDDATCQFEDFLHTLHLANLPPYRLTLKKNCPVILLRNLNPIEGLCNGTRLICHDFKSHVSGATICSDLEAEDDDVVEVNSKASAADGHLQQKHFSPPTPLSVDSTANGNGNGSDTAIWLTIFAANMVLRVNIDQIEPATRDWICKVQIVEIARPRESLDKKCTFQNFILEDEEECQIKAVMYADEIEQYADKLKLLHTYLISIARVKVSPTSYGKPIHKFYWILDKETVIEQIKPSHEVEKPLPPPTKLNITSFDRIPHLMVAFAAEIGISIVIAIIRLKYTSVLLQNTCNNSLCIIYADILAIFLRCGPQKNADCSHHRYREITLCDNQKNQFLFTLWEDFREIEGHEIASKMATEADLLVILGRSIGISTYQGLSLQTRYSSTVRVNSNYPQAVALINWAKENKTLLLTCPSQKTSISSSIAPMIVTTAGQQLISIAEISSTPSMGVFYVEAEIAVLDEFQDFCVLECSGCKQKKRTKDRKDFECPKCNRKTALRQSLSLNHVHEMLSNKVFKIQLRKSSWGSSNTTHATLSILSYMEKQHPPQTTTNRTSKKIKPLEISEVEVMATTTAAGSSNAPPKFEPPTPTKK
ncbi:hypothetical protein H5410_038631, partial [Solanum commersonii]